MATRLPVTLIGGFLGAGKTSLLHHLISEHQGGHLAVMVESPGPVNLDAKAMRGLCGAKRRLQDTVLEIPNAGEEEQVAWMTGRLQVIAAAGRFERILIEVAGTANPARLAEHFLPGGALAPYAGLEQIICVVDALEFVRTGRINRTLFSLWDFQNEQIAQSSLTVLNKCDLVEPKDLDLCRKALADFHPETFFTETEYGEVAHEIWSRRTSTAELEKIVQRVPLYLKEQDKVEQTPSLSSALYRVYRPFHPTRFWDWFNAEHAGLLRVKGLVWLASRHLFVGGISRTRWQNSCGAAGIWWDALPREEWPQDEAALRRMQENWREPYGDRRQEMVLIGDPALLAGEARRQLDACLLTEAEFARPVAEWRTLPDPFPEWDVSS